MPNGRSSRPCCRRRGLTIGQLSRYHCPRQVDLAFIPVQRRADRGIETGCAATILCNPSVSPWPGLARPPTSSLRRLRLRQDVDARDEPGQGVFGGKIRSKTLARMDPQLPRTALQFNGTMKLSLSGSLLVLRRRGTMRRPEHYRG